MLGNSFVPDDDSNVTIAGFSRAISRKIFNLVAGKGLLLQLVKYKSKVWWPTPPKTEIFEIHAALDVACVVSEGTVVLGAPVGPNSYRRSFTDARVDEFTPTFNNVALLEDGHVALYLPKEQRF